PPHSRPGFPYLDRTAACCDDSGSSRAIPPAGRGAALTPCPALPALEEGAGGEAAPLRGRNVHRVHDRPFERTPRPRVIRAARRRVAAADAAAGDELGVTVREDDARA